MSSAGAREGGRGRITSVIPRSWREVGEVLRAPTVLLLASVALFGTFLDLEPLLTFAAWGSDSGEYDVLTRSLLENGHFLLTGYGGWGFGYPYFPGTFEVGAAVAAVTGADPLLSLEIAVPTLAALSALPLFLLVRRLYPSDTVALLATGLSEVVFPRVFVLSHAAPASLGDLLVVAGLWLLVQQRKDPRWLAVLAPAAGALILTHHLSSYFFLLSAFGIVVGLEVYAPGCWSRRFPWRELVFLAGFTTALVGYWYFYAPPFRSILSQGLLGAPAAVAFAAGPAFLLVGALLVGVRRSGWLGGSGRLWRLRWPGRGRMLRDALILSLLIGAGFSYLLFFPIPGTSDVIPFSDLLYFLPFLALVPLAAAGSRGMASLSRLGTGTIGWFVAITGSAAFALATVNQAIPPDRHPEYLALPLILLAAVVIGRALGGLHQQGDRRGLAVGIALVVLLVGANAVVAYPPPQLLEGFQEGFTPEDVALASWAVLELPAGSGVASDHRLSDLYFGFSGGSPATWSAATCLFVGNNSTCALSELHGLAYPLARDPVRPLDAVLVDGVMVQQGVALNPNNPAVPMSSWAIGFLAGPGLYELYVNGDQRAYGVDLPQLPTAPPDGGAG